MLAIWGLVEVLCQCQMQVEYLPNQITLFRDSNKLLYHIPFVLINVNFYD